MTTTEVSKFDRTSTATSRRVEKRDFSNSFDDAERYRGDRVSNDAFVKKLIEQRKEREEKESKTKKMHDASTRTNANDNNNDNNNNKGEQLFMTYLFIKSDRIESLTVLRVVRGVVREGA